MSKYFDVIKDGFLTQHIFITCHCIGEFDEPYDIRKAVLIQKCRTHDTYKDALNHAHQFGLVDTDAERIRIEDEFKKPQFQRR